MRKVDNLPPYCAVVKNSRSLNFLDPSGPAWPVTGELYLYPQKNRWLDREVDGRTDGGTDVMKPTGDSRDYANATKSVTFRLGRDLADNAEVNVDPLSLCDCKG